MGAWSWAPVRVGGIADPGGDVRYWRRSIGGRDHGASPRPDGGHARAAGARRLEDPLPGVTGRAPDAGPRLRGQCCSLPALRGAAQNEALGFASAAARYATTVASAVRAQVNDAAC